MSDEPKYALHTGPLPEAEIEWLDASKKDLLNLCAKRFYYRHELGLVPKGTGSLSDYANAAQYGTALHAAFAALYEGHGLELVTCPCPDMGGCEFCRGERIPRMAAQFLLHYPVDPPIEDKDPRTRARGIEILHAYVEKYRRETFEVVAVEVPFELEFFSDECQCGHGKAVHGFEEGSKDVLCHYCDDEEHDAIHEYKPHLLFKYVGRIDLLTRENDKLVPWDHKSTSRYGEMFQIQFKLSGQMTGYMRSTHTITQEECFEGTINAVRVTTKIQDESFMRLTTRRTPDEFAEWEQELRETFDRIQRYRAEDIWPKHSPFACSAYNRVCEYYELCAAGSDQTRKNIIAKSFEVKPWDPMR